MAKERLDDATLEGDAVEAAFGTINGDYATDRLQQKFSDWSDSVVRERIPDDAASTDLGSRKARKGLVSGEFSFVIDAPGQVTEAADAAQAAETSFGRLCAAALGGAQVRSTGDDTAADSHTSTVVIMTTAGRHDENQLALFTIDTGREMRPIWSRSTATLTLGMALSAAPDSGGGDLVSGAENIGWVDKPAFSWQGRKIGGDTYLQREYRGVVFDLELMEAGEGEIPKFKFTGHPSEFTQLPSLTQINPAAVLANVVSGGEFLVAKHASAAATKDLDFVRASLVTNGGYTRIPGPKNASGHDATFGWRRGKDAENGPFSLTVHVAHDHTPPSACDAAAWETMVETPGTNDICQIMLSFGQRVAGQVCGVWARYLILKEWEMVDLDGLAAQKLTFGVETGYTAPPLTITTS
jgi:hypothetical protein